MAPVDLFIFGMFVAGVGYWLTAEAVQQMRKKPPPYTSVMIVAAAVFAAAVLGKGVRVPIPQQLVPDKPAVKAIVAQAKCPKVWDLDDPYQKIFWPDCK